MCVRRAVLAGIYLCCTSGLVKKSTMGRGGWGAHRQTQPTKGRNVGVRHTEGPEGVRGRNSDNTLVRSLLDGWEPRTSLADGLRVT